MLLEFANAVSERNYDWEQKGVRLQHCRQASLFESAGLSVTPRPAYQPRCYNCVVDNLSADEVTWPAG